MGGRGKARGIAAAMLVGAVLAVSACGPQEAGAAATYGDSRISEQAVVDVVQETLAAQGQPVDSPAADLTDQVLSRMIVGDLVGIIAGREGVEITDGELDAALAGFQAQSGGPEAAEAGFIEQGIAPSQVEPLLLLTLQAAAIGAKLVPNGTDEEKSAAVVAAVQALSDELDVTVSPRFGTWRPESLDIGPRPTDLSVVPDGVESQ